MEVGSAAGQGASDKTNARIPSLQLSSFVPGRAKKHQSTGDSAENNRPKWTREGYLLENTIQVEGMLFVRLPLYIKVGIYYLLARPPHTTAYPPLYA